MTGMPKPTDPPAHPCGGDAGGRTVTEPARCGDHALLVTGAMGVIVLVQACLGMLAR